MGRQIIAAALAFWSVMLLEPVTGHAAAETRADALADLGDYYARADQALARQLSEARALTARFGRDYGEAQLSAIKTGRPSRNEYKDFRENVRDLRKAHGAHVNNATYIGRLDDWPGKLIQWADYNVRYSLRRLWVMKITQTHFELTLIERDAKAALDAVHGSVDAIDPALRLQIVNRIRAAVLDLASWRERLASRAWAWAHYIERFGNEKRTEDFHQLIYNGFGWNLEERMARTGDPTASLALENLSDLDALVADIADPNLALLAVIEDAAAAGHWTGPADDPLSFAFDGVSVERFNPLQTGPAGE